MAKGRGLSLLLVVSLLANALSAPADVRLRRDDNEIDSKEDSSSHSKSTTTYTPSVAMDKFNDDDDDDDFNDSSTSAPSGGSNIFSLLRLAGAVLPNLSQSNQQKLLSNPMIQNLIQEFMKLDQKVALIRKPRQSTLDNEIEIDDTIDLKPPPLQKQEIEESDEDSSDSDENDDDDDEDVESDENNGAEVDSAENGNDSRNNDGNGNAKQDSDSNGTGESDYDSDEPPEGDGMGGGILGLLAGLSGGEDGQSDLGSLLAAVSGIVANLSGDGFDLNALIASGLGLFVGLLSEGEENPGAVIASYLLTSLETITGGGANNNGAFFGTFISKLIKGTSAGGDPDASSEENGDGNKMPMADSAGFFASLLMSLLGEMSKTSSGGSSHRRGDIQPWINSSR